MAQPNLPTPGEAGKTTLQQGVQSGGSTQSASSGSAGKPVLPGLGTKPASSTKAQTPAAGSSGTNQYGLTPEQQARYEAMGAHYQQARDGRAAAEAPKGDDYVPGSRSGSGGGNGGGSGSAVDTTPVASPTDYYSEAASTTERIVQGVDSSDKINAADQAWQNATQNFSTEANGILTQLQNVTEQDLANYANATGQTIADATAQINQIIAGLQDKMQPAEAGRVGRVDTVEEENLLQQIVDAQKQESENQINFAVQQGVNELTRAEEDAQAQFQTQRDQIAANERQSLDNSALYSEMRGDRGGIGKAQYDSIQNTAATNQLTVNKEQTKLATDTARQIADLRAKGEFQKADELLKITQSYLSELMQLKQWADQTNVGVDEFNIGVEQWEQEYNTKIQQALGELGINAVQYETGLNLDRDRDLQGQRQSLNNALAQYGLSNAQYTNQSDINRISNILDAWQTNANNMASTELAAANMTGAFSDATPTQQARQAANEQLAAAGQAMIAAGMTPSDEQLAAMGWTKGQYNAYKAAADAAKKKGGGGSGNNLKLLQLMRDLVETGTPLATIEEQLDYAVRSGNYSATDSTKSTDYVAEQKRTGYTGKPEPKG